MSEGEALQMRSLGGLIAIIGTGFINFIFLLLLAIGESFVGGLFAFKFWSVLVGVIRGTCLVAVPAALIVFLIPQIYQRRAMVAWLISGAISVVEIVARFHFQPSPFLPKTIYLIGFLAGAIPFELGVLIAWFITKRVANKRLTVL